MQTPFIKNLQACWAIGQPAPVAGMGATLLDVVLSNCDPVTVFRAFQINMAIAIETRDDRVAHGKDLVFKIDVKGTRRTFKQGNNGNWIEMRLNETTKRWNKTGNLQLRIGERDYYRDPSF